MNSNTAERKADIRRAIRNEIKKLNAAERAAASLQICQRVKAQPIWSAAQTILGYMPTTDEPDIWPLMAEALASGKNVALPRYWAAMDLYVACLIRQSRGDLQPGPFGILEPVPGCPILNLKQLDLAMVPGIGFTLDGGRLGRGRGYYDRLLAEVPGFKCGVAFDCQIIAEFPLEPHDIHLNCLVTPTRWYSVRLQPRS